MNALKSSMLAGLLGLIIWLLLGYAIVNAQSQSVLDFPRGGTINVKSTGIHMTGNSWFLVEGQDIYSIMVHARNTSNGGYTPGLSMNDSPASGGTLTEILNEDFVWYSLPVIGNQNYIYHRDYYNSGTGQDSNVFVDSVRVVFREIEEPPSDDPDTVLIANKAIISWDDNLELDLLRYRIAHTVDVDTIPNMQFFSDAGNPEFDPSDEEGRHFFRVAAEDTAGNVSGWTRFAYDLIHPVLTDTMPPARPTGVNPTGYIILNVRVGTE